MSLVNSTKNNYDDNVQEETEPEFNEDANESSIDVRNRNTNEMTRIPEITTEELQTAINKRQIPRQQRNQSRRHQSMR